MRYLIMPLIVALSFCALAQKPSLDFSNVNYWENLGKYVISNDGKWVCYEHITENQDIPDTLFLIGSLGERQVKFVNGQNPVISSNGQYLFYSLGSDLIRYDIRKKRSHKYLEAYSRFPSETNSNFMAIIFQDKKALIFDLAAGTSREFSDVRDVQFNRTGKIAIIIKEDALVWYDLRKGQSKLIHNGRVKGAITFCEDSALVFTSDAEKAIVYFSPTLEHAVVLKGGNFQLNEHAFSIEEDSQFFSADGRSVLFKAKEKQLLWPSKEKSNVDLSIWHYKDVYLQSQQRFHSEELYTFSINIATRWLIQLDDKNVEVEFYGGDYVLLRNRINRDEMFWTGLKENFKLRSISTGQIIELTPQIPAKTYPSFSKSGKYLSWLDVGNQQLYIFDLKSKTTQCITDKINSPLSSISSERTAHKNRFAIEGWLKDDVGVIIRDRYDLWLIDFANSKSPISLTGEYGRKSKVQCRMATDLYDKSVKIGESILISCFDEQRKYNGFLRTELKKNPSLIFGTLLPKMLYARQYLGSGTMPLKSANTDIYLVQAESDLEAPNLYSTSDFETYIPLSNFAPQKKVNWLTAELVDWPLKNGELRSGILYKPENFQSENKYPIIFHYYEILSNQRYRFRRPSRFPGAGGLDIAWYVSNGYCVFLPDIVDLDKGNGGENALNAVVSAAEFLTSKYPWINKYKMGIQGHSMGGYKTNYIVTQTKLFAAAQSSAGSSDLVSAHGDIAFGGKSLGGFYFEGQGNMGTALWDSPEVYMRESPIFSVKNVMTPLLIMHGTKDGAVPFGQAIELFTALRQLKKKVWLLEYEDQNHTLDGNSNKDFFTRQMQFFDHYLKDKPAPLWMIEGIPASDKGLKSGLVLDSLHRTP